MLLSNDIQANTEMTVFTLCCTATVLYLFEFREAKHISLKYLTESQEKIILLQKKTFSTKYRKYC